MTLFQAIILAIIEGLTEFLPISSTGHLIIASWIMAVPSSDFTKFFTVGIQFGTILSVLVLYFKRFFQSFRFYSNLLIAFIPAVIFGLTFSKLIDRLLDNVLLVGVMLFIGGVLFIVLDKWFKNTDKNHSQELTYPKAFKIGLFQCIALFPGASRSAATIIGGLTQGLNRKQAAEFSFFLAVPTMFAATGKKIFDHYQSGIIINDREWYLFGIGNLVGFLVALLAIKAFITYLTKHGFKLFGWYRIAVGSIIILLYLMGFELELI